ncbi:hypothetical protein DFJ74DRAFT_660308 [Hyaloraphidium curvatum]|nr:hypothetical protein DFJ74DRAFT_660308 [Hyaloraphidium curvatum]
MPQVFRRGSVGQQRRRDLVRPGRRRRSGAQARICRPRHRGPGQARARRHRGRLHPRHRRLARHHRRQRRLWQGHHHHGRQEQQGLHQRYRQGPQHPVRRLRPRRLLLLPRRRRPLRPRHLRFGRVGVRHPRTAPERPDGPAPQRRPQLHRPVRHRLVVRDGVHVRRLRVRRHHAERRQRVRPLAPRRVRLGAAVWPGRLRRDQVPAGVLRGHRVPGEQQRALRRGPDGRADQRLLRRRDDGADAERRVSVAVGQGLGDGQVHLAGLWGRQGEGQYVRDGQVPAGGNDGQAGQELSGRDDMAHERCRGDLDRGL